MHTALKARRRVKRIFAAKRKRLNLSQENLGKSTGRGLNIERDSISRIEIGTHFIADFELLALCKVLKATPGELLGF